MIGYLYALASSIFIGVANISAKEALRHEHSMEFSVFASVIAFFIMLPFIPWVDFGISCILLILIYLSAVSAALGFFFLSRSLRHMDISVVVPLSNISIIFTAALGVVVLNEWLSLPKFFGICLIIAGAYLLEIYPVREKSLQATEVAPQGAAFSNGVNRGHFDWFYPFKEFYSSKYLHYLFFGSVAISIAAIFDRIILKEADIISFMFFGHVLLAANYLFIYMFLHKEPVRKAIREAKNSLGWSLFFSLSRLIASFLFAYAVSMVYIGLAVALKRMSTLISVILAGRIFHENHIEWKVFASLLMVAGALLIVL